MSAGLPAPAATAAETLLRSRRRRRSWGVRLRRGAAPYALVAPTIAVIGAVLGYPLYLLGKLSFQHYGLTELIQHRGTWIGLGNYTQILHDSTFWHVVLRTVVFTTVNVGLTMVLSTLIALMLVRLGKFMRLLVSSALVFVWATPPVVAVNIWRWMVDYEFGVANYTLTKLHLGHFTHHDWFASTLSGFGVITALVVWGAIPFVAITLYAGLSQVPQELLEAASIDGSNGWRVFWDVTFPLLKPIFVILASLSVIWDFQVFTQVWIMLDQRPPSGYYLMSIYAFVTSFRTNEYGLGAAIALVMVAIMLCATFVYIRQMVRAREVA